MRRSSPALNHQLSSGNFLLAIHLNCFWLFSWKINFGIWWQQWPRFRPKRTRVWNVERLWRWQTWTLQKYSCRILKNWIGPDCGWPPSCNASKGFFCPWRKERPKRALLEKGRLGYGSWKMWSGTKIWMLRLIWIRWGSGGIVFCCGEFSGSRWAGTRLRLLFASSPRGSIWYLWRRGRSGRGRSRWFGFPCIWGHRLCDPFRLRGRWRVWKDRRGSGRRLSSWRWTWCAACRYWGTWMRGGLPELR